MLIIAPGQKDKGLYIFDFLYHKGRLCVLIRIASLGRFSNEYTQSTIFNIKNRPKSS